MRYIVMTFGVADPPFRSNKPLGLSYDADSHFDAATTRARLVSNSYLNEDVPETLRMLVIPAEAKYGRAHESETFGFARREDGSFYAVPVT